jgi:hypothetical protein
LKNRSDDKDPESEAVEIAKIAGQQVYFYWAGKGRRSYDL